MDARALMLLTLLTAGQADVNQLGSPTFKTREAASARLTKNADACIIQLLIGERSPDAEIRGRCKLIADGWYRRHAVMIVETLKPPGWRQFPFITTTQTWSLYPDAKEWPYLLAAGSQGQPVTDRGQKKFFSEATRLMLIDMVGNRQPTDEVLRVLCRDHRALCKELGWKVPP